MSTKRRILLFLYSNGNIVGSLLGLLGLGLFFGGIIRDFWFFIVLGMYGIGVLATPRSPTYELRFRNQATADEIRAELNNLVKTIKNKVPADILVKVEHIRDSVLDILPYIVDFNSSDHHIFIIRQTVLDYLPEALQNYLNLPRAFATLHPVKDGKTAKQILTEQLDLLDHQLQQVAADLSSNNAQALLIHGRFLEDKFSNADLLA